MPKPMTPEALWREAPSAADRFDPAALAGLPPGARRLLGRALAPGAPLARAVRLEMSGTIRLGDWHPFEAEQVIVRGRGMVWAARLRMKGLPIRGSDRLLDGEGAMRWALFGLIPFLRADGPDIARSARGRLRAETIWLPSALADPTVAWSETDGRLTARVPVDGEPGDLDLAADADGRLREVGLARWGNPGGGPFRAVPFGGRMEAEGTFQGLTIPTRVRVGWWFGTERFDRDGEFFRAEITQAEFR